MALRGDVPALLALILTTTLTASALARDPPPTGATPTAALDTGAGEIRTAVTTDTSNRMTIPVSVGGHGPFRFLIDTGAERTVIASELAARLGLTALGAARLLSISGEERVATVSIPLLEHEAGRMKDVRAPTLRQAHLGADGILGIDGLADKRVTIDFRTNIMTVAAARKREERWDPDTIVVSAKRRHGQLILVGAEIEGQRVSVIIDTGTQVSIGNMALKQKVLGARKSRASTPVTITSVTGGQIVGDYSRIARMRIGEAWVNDLPVAFADVHSFRAMDLHDRPALLLGMDALALFDRVSIDFANRKARFDLPDTPRTPGPGSRLAMLRDHRATR